ncbi:MAG: hypothetical protein ABH843_06190 [Candidatus Omnitrophota bacterium]
MVRCALIISIFLGLLSCGGLLYAASDEKLFTYEDMDIRDPFVPLVDKDGKLMVTHGSIDSIRDIVVEGILYDNDGESVVILNGLVLKENDQVGDIKVERIQKHQVVLSSKSKKYTLKLKE